MSNINLSSRNIEDNTSTNYAVHNNNKNKGENNKSKGETILKTKDFEVIRKELEKPNPYMRSIFQLPVKDYESSPIQVSYEDTDKKNPFSNVTLKRKRVSYNENTFVIKRKDNSCCITYHSFFQFNEKLDKLGKQKKLVSICKYEGNQVNKNSSYDVVGSSKDNSILLEYVLTDSIDNKLFFDYIEEYKKIYTTREIILSPIVAVEKDNPKKDYDKKLPEKEDRPKKDKINNIEKQKGGMKTLGTKEYILSYIDKSKLPRKVELSQGTFTTLVRFQSYASEENRCNDKLKSMINNALNGIRKNFYIQYESKDIVSAVKSNGKNCMISYNNHNYTYYYKNSHFIYFELSDVARKLNDLSELYEESKSVTGTQPEYILFTSNKDGETNNVYSYQKQEQGETFKVNNIKFNDIKIYPGAIENEDFEKILFDYSVKEIPNNEFLIKDSNELIKKCKELLRDECKEKEKSRNIKALLENLFNSIKITHHSLHGVIMDLENENKDFYNALGKLIFILGSGLEPNNILSPVKK